MRDNLRAHAARGATVARVWAHSDGFGGCTARGCEMAVAEPLQPRVGVYSEAALRRLDLVLAEAAAAGIKLILPLTNFEPFLGGVEWYVREILGEGVDKELFYTDPAIKDAYFAYVRMLLARVNSVTGVAYAADPTVMAWEV